MRVVLEGALDLQAADAAPGRLAVLGMSVPVLIVHGHLAVAGLAVEGLEVLVVGVEFAAPLDLSFAPAGGTEAGLAVMVILGLVGHR